MEHDESRQITKGLRAATSTGSFTAKPMGEGTGLGLDTVYRIVRKHPGNVSFVSRPGETCFRVRLPIRNTRL